MSGGEQLRDYLPVEAVAAAIAALSTRRADDRVVNICSGRPVSVRAQVERWIADAGAAIVPDLGRYSTPLTSHSPLGITG